MRSLVVAAVVATALLEGLALTAPSAVAAVGTHGTTVQIRIHDEAHALVTSVPAGRQFHPRVTVFAALKDDPVPTGQVNVMLYTDLNCTVPLAGAPNNLVGGTADPATPSPRPNRPGAWSLRATYPGDAIFAASTSACAGVTVTKAVPALTLRFEESGRTVSSVEAGHPFDIHLSVSGPTGGPAPTGDAAIRLYRDSTCTSLVWMRESSLFDRSYSTDATFGSPGEFSANASYGGDANYLPGASTGCVRLTVTRATVTPTTTVHDSAHATVSSVAAGSLVHPRVSINTHIQSPPTGYVRARAFADGGCQTPSAAPVDVPVVSMIGAYTGTADVTALTVTATPGTHSFRVDYLGDSRFFPVLGGCAAYTVTGATASPTASGTASAAPTSPAPTATSTTHPSTSPTSSPTSSAIPTTPSATQSLAPGSTTEPGATSGSDPGSASFAPASSSDPGAPAASADPLATVDPLATLDPAATSGPVGAEALPPAAASPAPGVVPAAADGPGGGVFLIVLMGLTFAAGLGAAVLLRRRFGRVAG